MNHLLLILLGSILSLIGMGFYRAVRSRTTVSSKPPGPAFKPVDSGEFIKSFFDYSQDGFVVVDDSLTMILVNDAYCRMTGRNKEDMLGKRPPYPGWTSKNWEKIEDNVFKVLHGRIPPFETKVYRVNGNAFPASFSVSKIMTHEGKTYYSIIIKDITERTRTEVALRASEAKFRSQFKHLPIPMYTWQWEDEDFILVDFNDAAEKITEGGVALMLGTRASKMYQNKPDIYDDLQRCFREKTSFQRDMEYHYQISGKTGHLSVTYAFVPPEFILVHTEDKTARVEAEEKLRASEARLRTAVEHLPFSFFMIDSSGRYSMVNSAMRDSWHEDIIGKKPEQVSVEPETLAIWLENNRRAFAGETVRGEVSYALKGKRRYFYNILAPVYDNDVVHSIIGVNIDVTDRKEAEQALRESDARLRLMVEQLPAVMWTVDKELRFTSSIGIGLKDLNLTPNEVVGITLFEYFKTDDPDFLPIAMHRKSLQGKATTYETVWNGNTWEAHTEPLRDEQGEIIGCLALALNITDRKQAEILINQSREELRALAGRLHEVREEESTIIARRIHDELGQTLTGIRWDLTRLNKQMVEFVSQDVVEVFTTKMQELTAELDLTIQRLREISARLRPLILDDLGLLGAFEWQINEFKERTGITCELIQSDFDEGQINMDPARSTAAFRILQEVLANIRQHAEAKHIRIKLRNDGNLFYFSIKDDGKGMVMDDSSQMKSLGILGMRERAQAFGGSISIESSVGTGTCVRVTIPEKSEN